MTRAEKAMGLIGQLAEKVGFDPFAQSSVGDGLAAQMEANGKHYRTILEIGTLRGVSAVVLAHFAENVITIDVERHKQLPDILKWLPRDTAQRISTVLVTDNDSKARLVNALSFDFAFIDAGHSELQVSIDFGLCRKCGAMLFHDYPMSGSGCNGPGLVLDAARDRGDGVVTTDPPFAWWRAE